MRRHLLAFIFVTLPGAIAFTVVADPATAQPPPRNALQPEAPTSSISSTGGVDVAALDRTADPCVDFYQFACGGWMASHPVPADRSISSRFNELQDRNDETLHRILEAAAANPTADQLLGTAADAAAQSERQGQDG